MSFALPLWVLVAGCGYIALCRALVHMQGHSREAGFAVLNIAAVYFCFFWESGHTASSLEAMGVYLVLITAQYAALRVWGERPGWAPWLAFATPIGVLILFRMPALRLPWTLIGLSYVAFRTSYLVLEVRNGGAKRPGFLEYLGFAFFAPTFSVGPISPYAQHRLGFNPSSRSELSVGRAALRVLVGAVKFRFLGAILNQFSYVPLMYSARPFHWRDLLLAAVAYYLFLYCNFSGACDIAIGSAGLMGISVAENFNNPLAARNVKDYWNRWHITLSTYMRDVVFSPLSKTLVRAFGPAHAHHAVAISIFVVFLLVGVWHGFGWNYALFGLAHGLALSIHYYYTLGLKAWLGKEGFAAYNRNVFIHAIAVLFTFMYVTAALFIFSGNLKVAKVAFYNLRAH